MVFKNSREKTDLMKHYTGMNDQSKLQQPDFRSHKEDMTDKLLWVTLVCPLLYTTNMAETS